MTARSSNTARPAGLDLVASKVSLTPWPDETDALAKAVARLREAVGSDWTDDRLCALGAAASALVEKEAPGAPQSIRDEAVIRFAGYLAQSDFGGVRAEQVGEVRFEHAPNHGMAFRHSGAKAFLSPWKVRRAGAIG